MLKDLQYRFLTSKLKIDRVEYYTPKITILTLFQLNSDLINRRSLSIFLIEFKF